MNTTRLYYPASSFAQLGWVLSFSMIWSSAFIVGKIGLRYTDPYTLLTARFLLASILLLLVCLATMRPLVFGDRTLIRDALTLGALNNALYLGLTFTALRFISPELVVIVVSCAPFITTAIAGILRIEKVGARNIMGIVTGFCGVLVITLARPVGTIDPFGLSLAFLGTFSFAAATVFYRNKATLHAPQQVNFWQSIIATVLLLPLAVTHASSLPANAYSLPLASAVVYLAVVVTIGGMWMWLLMIRHTGATTASTYHLANPACGLLLSYLVFGTEFRLTDWIGVAIIVLGLFIVTHLPTGERHGTHN
jgi:drug/metabolite transporter (DMT)-like permease